MSLVLRLMNSGTLPDGRTSVAMVGGVLTIGRGEENDLSLPDPDRLLSKRHCVLEERSGDYVIIDISTNGAFLNYGSERLGNIPTPLNHGDVIQLGSFELQVEIDTAKPNARVAEPLPPAAESRISMGSPLAGHTASGGRDLLEDVATSSDDFLDNLLGPDVARPGALLGADRRNFADDPFAATPHPYAPPFDEGPLSFPEGASVSDHRPTSQDHFSAPSVQSPVIPDGWDDLGGPEEPEFPGPNPASVSAAAPAPQRLRPAPMPPPAVAPAVLTSSPASIPHEPAATATHGSDEAAARAFLAAAGADHLSIPDAELAKTMARLGRVFAAMVGGMREILMTRASIKSEMRMNRTMISMGENNPLKFSISAEQAVEAMIRPSVRGYLDAETATTEAFNDIRAHEVAMVSGMEAALKSLLARLGPDQLSARIESASTFGGLLGGKKARYWEAYEKMYAQIARETEDDFQSAFGREFARAYEEQLRKL